MKVRVIVATVVGIAASAAVGVGTYGLMHLGDCEAAGHCAMPSGLVLVLFNASLPVAILAAVAGGGPRVAAALFLAVGAGAIAAGGTFGWVFGGAFLLVGCVALGAIGYLRRFASPSTAMAAMMQTALAGTRDTLDGPGDPAVGTVLAVSDTGTTVNDDPLARLRLRVEPADGSDPFEAVVQKLVSRLATPRPGDRFAVEYDPADRTRLAVREALPAEPRPDSLVDQLSRLDELRRSGALTQSEFEAAKLRMLGPG